MSDLSPPVRKIPTKRSTVRTTVRRDTVLDKFSHHPAVFLDRDGTLMEEVEYCSKPEDVHVFEGVPEALRQFKDAGFRIIIITNQSGIGRGLFTEEEYQAVQEELYRQIGEGVIDATYYCPDDPQVSRDRRKPAPTMVFEALKDHRIDAQSSYFIGDKDIDCQCGKRAGVKTILVKTGYGSTENPRFADHHAEDLADAARYILGK